LAWYRRHVISVALAAAWGFGLLAGDPLSLTAKVPVGPHAAVQAYAGWRLLGNEELEWPGPLVAVDYLARAWWLHAGVGTGVGWYGEGCWFDSVAEVCTDGGPAVLLRVPLGVDVRLGRVELFVEAVPALRLAPDPNVTFLGGFGVRVYP
jgi:hypothetical protein